jgi:hypothetical protein
LDRGIERISKAWDLEAVFRSLNHPIAQSPNH